MEKRNMICISCPLGCPLTVTLNEGSVTEVSGNTCARGEAYGRKEATAPTRIVTSTVRVTDGHLPVVSVKTSCDIPREKITDIMKELAAVSVAAPVRTGDIILENAGDTGVSIVATKNISRIIPDTGEQPC